MARKIALDPGFGGIKVAEVNGVGVDVEVVPSVVGIGTTEIGVLSVGTRRMRTRTMAARAYGLGRVLDIQARAQVDLINDEENSHIRQMWELDTWPQKWSNSDVNASEPIEALSLTGDGRIVAQALLI